MKVKFILMVILIGIFSSIKAQLTSIYTDNERLFKNGIESFESGNLNQSDHYLEKYLQLQTNENLNNLFTAEARLLPVLGSFLSDTEDSEEKMNDYLKDNSTSILMNNALIGRGNYYFRKQEYGQAILSYEQIDMDGLEYYKEDEVKFKLAYSYFVKRQFDKAAILFKDLSLTQRKFYFPSNYYYGICQFLNSDFDRAISSFDIIQNSSDYKNYIPYYLVQLYFTQGNYDKTIEVGEDKLKMPDVENYYNIHQLVGQSYFIKKEYDKALPHLELYEKNTAKLSESDFYQLGYIYHELGDCKNSVKNLTELTGLESQLGQYSNYYIADCYLRMDNKESARTAFKNASALDFDKMVQEESLLNYGKLSSETGYDREAINTLITIKDNSAYYQEAQSVLKGIFINTKDYAAAQQILEELDDVTSQLYEAYQIVCYYKALQEINDGKYDLAEEDLMKSNKISRDIRTSIQTNYWLGDINYRKGEYIESNKYLDKYFILIQGIDRIEKLATPPFAHYVQGYNYYKIKNYPASIKHFQETINSFKEYTSGDKSLQNEIIYDASIRLGDAYFYNKNLTESLKKYNYAIEHNAKNSDYALYQKAIIMGLQDKQFEKIALLNDVIGKYKNSGIRPVALFELAGTYRDLGQFDKAYSEYNAIVNNYMENTGISNKALMQMGLISYNKGSLDQAINNYKLVIGNNPAGDVKKEALKSLEEIYINDKKDPETYIEYIKNDVGIDYADINTDSLNFVTAKVFFESDSIHKALNSLNQYLEKYDKGYYALDARFYRAESYLMNKEYKSAVSDYEYIINQGYNNYYEPALYKSAVINFNYLKNYNKAIEQYKKLTEILKDENKKYEAQLGIMRSAFMINDFDNVNSYGNFILNNPLTTDKEKSAAHYYIAKVADYNKKYDVALLHLNKVINENPNSNLAAESRYLISKIYFERNEIDLAKRMVNDASSKNSAYPYWIAKGLILLADISIKKEDLFNAKAALEAVKENYTEDKGIIKDVNDRLAEIETKLNEKSRLETPSENGNLIMDEPK